MEPSNLTYDPQLDEDSSSSDVFYDAKPLNEQNTTSHLYTDEDIAFTKEVNKHTSTTHIQVQEKGLLPPDIRDASYGTSNTGKYNYLN